MLHEPLAIFLIVILSGLYILFRTNQGKSLRRVYGLFHAFFAAASTVLLVLVAKASGSFGLWGIIGLAVLAASLGIVLGMHQFYGHERKRVLIIHIGLALLCTLLLVYNAVSEIV